MTRLIYITHPDVVQDPAVPVTQWALSARGRARMAAMLARPWVGGIGAVFSSAEQKSLDGAAILGEHLGLVPVAMPELGEIDRSATGFGTAAEYSALMRTFFAQPEASADGWETAVHAQQRVAEAVAAALQRPRPAGDVAIVGHGTVGTLLLCRLAGREIVLGERPPGANGGYYFVYDLAAGELVQGWQRIDDPPVAADSG